MNSRTSDRHPRDDHGQGFEIHRLSPQMHVTVKSFRRRGLSSDHREGAHREGAHSGDLRRHCGEAKAIVGQLAEPGHMLADRNVRAELGDILWLECNAAELNGVSFAKGCFVGQENTARMNWRAKVNRRLFVVHGDGAGKARVVYPELGLAVVHVKSDSIPDRVIIPGWR